MKVTIELTEKEALELWSVAGNGYGDGDFYGEGGYGDGKRSEAAFRRAMWKLADALELKHRDSYRPLPTGAR